MFSGITFEKIPVSRFFNTASSRRIMLLHHKGLIIVSLIVIAAFQGCEKTVKEKPAGLPELIPCEITVKLSGSPLPGASVRLLSTPPSKSWSVMGTTNASGVAKMQTYGDFNGAPEGDYTVLISKSQTDDIPQDAMSGGNNRIERPQSKMIVDPAFANPTKTQLRLTVTGKGPIRETFEVTGP